MGFGWYKLIGGIREAKYVPYDVDEFHTLHCRLPDSAIQTLLQMGISNSIATRS